MVRLDKFLCDCRIGTRSQVRDYIRLGLVSVNGNVTKKADTKIEESGDVVAFRGQTLSYRRFAYYMLHKPAGVVSATTDNTAPTVLSLLKDVKDRELFPVGRLDKDTTGLILLTNDGELAHRLLSPKKHVDKTYLTGLRAPLKEEDARRLREGVFIGDDTPTMPAAVQLLKEDLILLTIQEGRFHQVKRMLKAVGNEVISLKRISFGPLTLDESLAPGQYRELTDGEILALKAAEQKSLL